MTRFKNFNPSKKTIKSNKILSFLNDNKAARIIKNLSEQMFRRIRISYRLIASFLLLSLLPIVIIGFVSVNRSKSAMEDNVSRYSKEIARQLSTQVLSQLDVYSDILKETSLSTQLSDYVNSLPRGDYLEIANTTRELQNYLLTKSVTSNVEDIGFIPAEGDREFYSKKILYRENKDGIFNRIMDSDGKETWIYMETGEVNESGATSTQPTSINMPVLFGQAKGTLTVKTLGVVYLIPKKNAFNSIVSGIDLDQAGEGEVYILNEDNIAIGTSNQELYGKKISENIIEKLNSADASSNKTGHFHVDIDGRDHLVSYSYIGDYGWKLVTTVPFSNLMEKAEAITGTVITIGIICFIFILLITYFVTQSVTIPLKRINTAVESLKQGDFTQQINDRFTDEIAKFGLNFNNMISNVSAMIKDVKKITQKVVDGSNKVENHSMQSLSASEQIAEAVSEIAAGSSEQALESQKGKENIDNLAEKLNLVVESTAIVEKSVHKTKALCEDSINVVNHLNSSAADATNAAETIVKQINELNKDMKQINNIVRMIFKIADQTNLLALNAAIEAARAGEAGKGFVVVADEVKKLAEQSKNASSSISDIITNILKKTAQVVDAANTTSESIHNQMSAVKQTDDTFRAIVTATEEIVVQLDNMNELINSMDALKSKAVSSMEHIAGISQSAAAATEEVNATTEEQIASAHQLADLAKDLNELAVALEQSTVKFKV